MGVKQITMLALLAAVLFGCDNDKNNGPIKFKTTYPKKAELYGDWSINHPYTESGTYVVKEGHDSYGRIAIELTAPEARIKLSIQQSTPSDSIFAKVGGNIVMRGGFTYADTTLTPENPIWGTNTSESSKNFLMNLLKNKVADAHDGWWLSDGKIFQIISDDTELFKKLKKDGGLLNEGDNPDWFEKVVHSYFLY